VERRGRGSRTGPATDGRLARTSDQRQKRTTCSSCSGGPLRPRRRCVAYGRSRTGSRHDDRPGRARERATRGRPRGVVTTGRRQGRVNCHGAPLPLESGGGAGPITCRGRHTLCGDGDKGVKLEVIASNEPATAPDEPEPLRRSVVSGSRPQAPRPGDMAHHCDSDRGNNPSLGASFRSGGASA
jgi:hypothetical protein